MTETQEIKEIKTIVHRDISWLSFNYRVLQEAKDPAVPLLERVKFLAIYSSNLDEFYRVRVAQHRNLVRIGKKTKRELDYKPKELLKEIHKIVNKQQEEFSEIFDTQIIPALRDNHIHIIRRLDMTQEQESFVENYFQDKLLPFVQPVLLVRNKIRLFLNTGALYLGIALSTKERPTAPTEYAIIKIPSDYLPRFVELPSQKGRHELILLDDIVRQSASWMFPGYTIEDTYSIKLTRDADLYIDDEFSGDLIQKIKASLQKRNVGPASRFVHDRTMPRHFLDYLSDMFGLEKYDIHPEGRYHNNFDFFKFPDFGIRALKYPPLPPLPFRPLENAPDFFKTIAEKDRMIHFPYHSYESVVRFFEEAATDPGVTHLKIVQYRVARKSRIMQALMTAVRKGKQVTVFIEVKARFDEEANLKWGETLQAAGVTVHYSMPGIKVHSKLAMIRRVEKVNDVERVRRYAYLSTGNFHEDTAKVYSDFGLFTADERLTEEMSRVFAFLENPTKKPNRKFKHLLVGQFNLRDGLEEKIDREIKLAKQGKPARIVLKMNSLEDNAMVEKLHKASNAGVEIRMIIRGICTMIPNVPQWSENIQIHSIVDRFLEHARVFMFYNEGAEEIYLSSADFMYRNLSARIETTFPVYDEDAKNLIRQVIDFQWNDNIKSRYVNGQQDNLYVRNENPLAIRAQNETYFYLKNMQSL